MKTLVEIVGCFPALRALDVQQFINAIEPRLIDIRSPRTGLQIDLFGRVSHVEILEEQGLVKAEIDVDDAFLQKNLLSREQLDEVLVGRISKLRHPATGVMHPVTARLAMRPA
ncbi:MAG TPA: hypothetical protein VN114_08230 [Oxalicibacterium sp.]|uniref:hypothetical protein n=1 Tax=Oxalicibacterium sp. TaxID=2766525 RepID=UPI002BD855AF|nr:hypothetical protein [Oxalicibacterium sp.]HWU98484.1 hypothetical protein [Oxalicibacterium sp.]